MSVIRRYPVEVCDECGAAVSEIQHATSTHQNGPTHWIETVPADQLARAVSALREIAERTDVPADFANAAVRLRWVHERATNALGGQVGA